MVDDIQPESTAGPVGIDEGFGEFLQMLTDPAVKRMIELSPDEARAAFVLLNNLGGPPVEGVESEDRTIPGPTGEVPVRIVRPLNTEPTGILVWFHGGGFVIGDLETADDTTRRLAAVADCVVVSVDYRLAPEHRAPAAADDCWSALRWVAEHRIELAGSDVPIAVGGDSAGGNLAAVVAQRAVVESGPDLAAQLLVYPVVDFDQDAGRYPSYDENGDGYFLTAETMAWFADHYIGPDGDPTDPQIAPIKATDDVLARTAPAIVHVAGFDPLRDEGLAYARRLRDAGAAVELRVFPSMIHGFWAMIALTPVASEAVVDAADRLARLFRKAA